MGLITNSYNDFISAEYIYSKIKRQFKSFEAVNLIDDVDFNGMAIDILRQLGSSSLKECEAVLLIKDRQAILPKDFHTLHAAYRCKQFNKTNTTNRILQNKSVFETEVTYDVLCPQTKCEIQSADDEKLLSRITVRQYVDDNLINYEFNEPKLLTLIPHVRPHENYINSTCNDFTINDGYIFTNFKDDAIYLLYYGYPFNKDGIVMIPNNPETEKAIEWGIKYELLLNFWLVDDLPNAANKFQEAQQQAEKWLAEAKHHNKIPSFNTMVNFLRNLRNISKVDFFNQMDRR